MEGSAYVTGGFYFELPSKFPGVSGAVIIPENPAKWAEALKLSLESEKEAISLFAEMIADGGETVQLTFAPCNVSRDETGGIVGDNFNFCLSRDSAIKIGKALIALAELNTE